MNMIGKEIGTWKIEKKLGEGGMGEVYYARHIHLGTPAAVKALSQELTGHQKFRERFLNEARAQAQLIHPHIAQLLDYIEQDDQFFLVLEYIPGGTLADIIDNANASIDINRALRWTKQALSALDYAHQRGIIHRDIKPSNIMLDQSGNVKVGDFGIALEVGKDRITTAGQCIGTPGYMSPEQIMSPMQIDHRTDVYAMGAVLYELLTRRSPFSALRTIELRQAHVEDPVIPPSGFNPDLPFALESIVLKALEKHPNDRYYGCGDFARAIETFERGATPAAIPHLAASPKPPVRATKRPPYAAGAINLLKQISNFNNKTTLWILGAALLTGGLIIFIFILWATGILSDNPGTDPSNRNSGGSVETGATYVRMDRIDFVRIQPGEFEMGSLVGETDEKPVRRIRITRAFEIGKYEITQSQWQYIMGNNRSKFIGADRPVENVSWEDAQEFIRKLNDKNDGFAYRLPTEAEWEYACTCGGGGVATGDNTWHEGNSGGETHPVGKKKPNAWGLYDINGNVWEWVQDWYDSNYSLTEVIDPQGPSSGKYKVNRGGSWVNSTSSCRATIRGYDSPASRASHIGFRLIRAPH